MNDPALAPSETGTSHDTPFLRFLEKATAYLSIAGSLMMANKIFVAWYVYLGASSIGMLWSWKKRYRHMLVMNSFFTAANIWGIYNYLL